MPACSHCGYGHFKKSGRLKYYVGALKCPVYVELLMEEIEADWGARTRKPKTLASVPLVDGRRKTCGAPPECVCYWKGTVSPNGRRWCFSPDGFPSEVPEGEKIIYVERTVTHGEAMEEGLPPGDIDSRWIQDQSKLCEHTKAPPRRPPKPPEKDRQRTKSRGKGGKKIHGGNNMPVPPEGRVVVETLLTRIAILYAAEVPITSLALAKMAGFTERKDPSDG